MSNELHELFKIIGDAIQKTHTQEHELAAIWLNQPLQTLQVQQATCNE